MDVLKTDVEKFEYKEFVSHYLKKIIKSKEVSAFKYLNNIILDTPQTFYNLLLKNNVISQKFVDYIEDEYGKLWVSNTGTIDLNLIETELKTFLTDKGHTKEQIRDILYYLAVDILFINTKYHSELISAYACYEHYGSKYLSIEPIPKEYRNISTYFKDFFFKEDFCPNSQKEKLEELFTAADTIFTDEISKEIIESIKEIVFPNEKEEIINNDINKEEQTE